MNNTKYNCIVQIGDMLFCGGCKKCHELTKPFTGALRDYRCPTCKYTSNCKYQNIVTDNFIPNLYSKTNPSNETILSPIQNKNLRFTKKNKTKSLDINN